MPPKSVKYLRIGTRRVQKHERKDKDRNKAHILLSRHVEDRLMVADTPAQIPSRRARSDCLPNSLSYPTPCFGGVGDSNPQWTSTVLAARGATRYNWAMIRSFRHKGVERFFKSGSRAGIQAAHASRLARQLSALDVATSPEDMNRPGWDWHPLKGGLFGHWSVSVNGNWRLTFAFENGDAVLVDYQDYH